MNLKKALFKERNFLIIELGSFNLKVSLFCPQEGKIRLRKLWMKKVSNLSEEDRENELVALLKDKFTLQELKSMKTFFIFIMWSYGEKRAMCKKYFKISPGFF